MATEHLFTLSAKKYACVFFPLLISIIFILQDIHTASEIKPFVLLLLSSLFVQSIMLRSLFSDYVDEFSENLSRKPLILYLTGIFGAKVTVVVVSISKYFVASSLIIILLVVDLYQISSYTNTIAIVFALGLMLDPIMNDIFDSEEFNEIVNSITIFLAYMALIIVGIGAATLAQEDPSNLLLNLMPEFLFVALIYSFLLTRAQFLVMVSFKQKTEYHAFSVSIFALILYLAPQLRQIFKLI